MDVAGLVSGLLSMSMTEAFGVVGFVYACKWVFGKISVGIGK